MAPWACHPVSPTCCAVPCWRLHGRAKGTRGSTNTVLLHPAALGSPTSKSSRAGWADPRTNLPARLFFQQRRAGASSRLLQMFGRSLGQGARRLQLPRGRAAAATSLPGCPLSHVPGCRDLVPGCRAPAGHRRCESSGGNHLVLPAGLVPELTNGYIRAEGQGWCQQCGRTVARSLGR